MRSLGTAALDAFRGEADHQAVTGEVPMRRAVFAVILLLSSPAGAHDPALQAAQAPAHNPLDCWCLAKGKKFAPGESICLRTAEGGRMAECRMETNVMSWGITETPCPET
jgi:hypothetical protein